MVKEKLFSFVKRSLGQKRFATNQSIFRKIVRNILGIIKKVLLKRFHLNGKLTGDRLSSANFKIGVTNYSSYWKRIRKEIRTGLTKMLELDFVKMDKNPQEGKFKTKWPWSPSLVKFTKINFSLIDYCIILLPFFSKQMIFFTCQFNLISWKPFK